MTQARAKAERARVFFALWPPETTRATLSGLAVAAQSECGGRAVAAGNIHLTLFFVGEVERPRVAALEECAGSLEADGFELPIDRIGYWRHNRIVWAGTARCPRALTALESRLRSALGRLGVESEKRPYAPHITLVRKAARKPAPAAVAPCLWLAQEFVLVESIAVTGTVRYQPLARWPLIMPR